MTPAKKERPASDPLPQLRELCLALPEAHEVTAWGEPTFRVRNKIFAMYASAASHHGKGRPGVWCNCTPLEQDLLLHADARRYFKPPYVGPGGWIGVYLDRRPSWRTLADIVSEAYRLTAPARLVAHLDGAGAPVPRRRAN
jgi:predicted DNA-binding protein (MmcQ/YjbR family)